MSRTSPPRRRPRICIVSTMHPSLNPRVVKEADALAEAGYEVVLIAPDYSAWGREADTAFAGRPWRVVAAPRFGPLAPPVSRARELVRRGLARIALTKLGRRDAWALRAMLHPAAPDLVRAARATPADLFIGHYPAGLLAAGRAAEAQGVPFGFDAEDFHPGDLPDAPGNELARGIIREVERTLLPRAAYVTAAAPLIAEAYAEEYGIAAPEVVMNVFPLSRAPAAPPGRRAGERPSLYWFSQTIGPDRGLECLIAAAARSRTKPAVALRGACPDGFADRLRALARDRGLDDLRLLEPAPPERMEALAAEHDAGFVGETGHSRNRRIMLTNKQFTYLLAGLPAVMSDIPSHRRFAEAAGEAVLLYRAEDADSLAAAIDELFGEPGRLGRASAEAWRLGRETFNWEREKHRLLESVRGILPPGQRRVSPVEGPGQVVARC